MKYDVGALSWYPERSELPGMKSELFEYNIKRNGHYEPAEYFFQIITGDFFGDLCAYQNAYDGTQRKPD